MQKIIVSVTNDISTDQRVEKVCNSLFLNGYKILLVGRKLTNSTPVNRPYPTKRMRLFFNKSVFFYAEYNIRLFLLLLFSKKDILLSNDLDSLPANFLASKIQNKKLVFDSHELFSEVPELVSKPRVKGFWRFLENYFYPKLKNTYTVCDSIATHYKKIYNTNFLVIKNTPLESGLNTLETTFHLKKGKEKIILYQGAVNVGRGLDLIIDSMAFLPDFKFVIIGTGDVIDELKEYVEHNKLTERVVFLGRINPKELKSITPQADVGVSVEEDLGLNYRYALPNKLFDYIQAEVPVLVSNLPEMKNIVTNYNVGEIIEERSPEKVALLIKKILSTKYTSNLQKAKKELIWKYEEEKLLNFFSNLN